MVVTPVAELALAPRAVDRNGHVLVDLPASWVVEVGPPTVAHPPEWSGGAPCVVVAVEVDELAGDELAARVVAAAVERLADPVLVDLRGVGDGVEVVVGHRHWGADVTTVERHHCLGSRGRWVVSCSVADGDLAAGWSLASRVVASLAVRS
jgi:hypothetical protein